MNTIIDTRRQNFEAWCNRRALDLSMNEDAWNRPKYKHDMIEAMWLGYNWACTDANLKLAGTRF